ncbi:MAG: hypothetical protein ABI123_01120 [Ginsengibacter sp.]
MRKWHLPIIMIIFLCGLSSCSSLRKAQPSKSRVNLDESTIHVLDGKFIERVKIPNKKNPASLSWNIFDRGYNAESQESYIEIKAISSNQLSISYWDSTTLLKSKIFKGRIKNDYFIFKRKYLVIPAIFVNLFRNRSFRIGLLPNNNLITDYSQFSFATFYIIFPDISVRREFDVEYRRIE